MAMVPLWYLQNLENNLIKFEGFQQPLWRHPSYSFEQKKTKQAASVLKTPMNDHIKNR